MPGKYLIVSIFDVVFARGEPLAESELWSVLHQCAICLLELLQHGDKNFSEISSLAVTPDSLGFRSDGSAGISSSTTQQRNLYSAPELHHGSCKSVRDLEKSFIYSLGKVLYYAAEYSPDRNQDVCISRNLDSILSAMCEENPASRLSVEQVLQACSVHAERYMDCDYHLCTRQMYTYIMGSSESEEDSMQGIQSLSGKDKENRARRVRGKHKRKSRSRSRSRSPSRRDRSDDSSYYQSLKGQRHGNHIYDVNQPPPYHEHLQRSLHSTPPSAGRSYHLSDITFSLDSNVSSHKSKNHHSQSNVISPHNNPPHSRPTSGISNHKNETAYDKYVRLKERQRKLKILRQGLFGDLPEDQTSSILSDPMDFPGADTRSQISYTQGAYMPELYNKYGSEMALRMGRESDRESIISSEASLIHDHHAMRSADVYHVAEPQHQQPVVEKMTRQKTSEVNLPTQKTKEYYGPEFVHKTSKPIIRVPVTMRGDSLKSASHGRRVVIVLLTGQKLEAMVDPSTTGQQMFESIITHIELPEFFFFGLTYVNDGEHFFIEPDMKLHKIAPEGWKDGWKGNMPTITLTIYLRLKFYPDHIGMLRHQISRHLLYLQLRHDILEERLLCNEDRCMALTGLALQAEYGDYDKETMGRNYFMQEHYYPNRIIKRVGTSYIRDNTSDVHEKYSGITDRQAELEFIKMCLTLHEYGVHFYKLNRRKNDNNSIVWVGISVRYLVLAENQSYQRVIIQQDPWNMIQKISFNKHRFSIQSKPDYGKGKPPKLNYFTNSFRKGRYLLQFSTAQHRFQLNMRAREAQIDSQDLTLDSLAQLDAENNMADQGGVDIEHLPESPGPEGNNRLDVAGPADRCPIPYMHPPPYMADTSVSMLDLRQRYTLPQNKHDSRMHAASTGDIVQEVNREVSTEPMYVIEMASQSLDPLEDIPPNETVSTTLQNRISNELLSPEYPDRHVFEVTLEKEPQSGIGITIVGGESTSKLDLGIFVKSVTPKGPADRDGRIKSGDRLIAINEQSLEGVQHHVAVQMIRDSTEKVKLLVSQIKPPSSIRRKSYDDVTPVKLRGSKASPSDKDVYRKISSASSSSSVTHSVHSHVNMDSNINTDQKNVDIPVNTYSNDDQSVVDGMTMSHVESMQSELISASEHLHVPPPVHDPDDTENDAESLTDSEIDEGIQAIVDGRTLEKMKIQDSIRPAEQDEWMKIENIESPKHHVTMSDDTYKVILGKKDGGFGLSVMGGADTSAQHGGIYVRYLTEGGPASLEGSIQIGDRILEVHEIPLRGVTHKQALDIIDQAPTKCVFVMQRRASTSQRSSVRSISSGSSVEVQNMKQKVVEEKICLPRVEPGVKAEVGIRHREHSDAEKDREGREVKSEEESESSSILSSAGPNTSKGEKNDSMTTTDATEQKDSFVNEENIYSVDLTKGSSGFGFSVHGGVDVEMPGTTQGLVHIKKLFVIGPAAASGKIQEGDVILEVNGKSVKGLTHAEAMAVLRSASQVNLLMYRPSPEQLSQMFIPESEDLVHHQPSSKKLEETSYSETESEDEPILYRDTLPLREEVISPPSAFTSPRSEYSEEFVAPPPPKSPPPLPKSPPPSFSVQSSPGIPGARKIASPSLSLRSEPAESGQDGQAMGRWGNFENLKLALSPRSVYSEDMNSTTEEEYEESDMDERFNQRVQLGGYLKKLARSDSSQSEGSQSSTDSIVRSPLKDTYGTSDSMRSTNSVDDSCGDDINTGEWHEEVDGELSDFQEPSAPRGSPCEDDEEWNRIEEHGRREEDLKESENSEEEFTRSLGPGEMEVVLRKEQGKGLGFTFTGGVSKGGCFIKGIVHDPALSDGRLKAGDKLIKVNDIDLTNLSHSEAVTYFKEAVGDVRIRVYHDPHQETAHEEEDQKSGNIGLGLRLELTDSLLSQSSGYEADSALTTGELTDVTGIVTQLFQLHSGEYITNLASHVGDSGDHITNLTSHLGDSGDHITNLTSHLGDSGDHITNLTSHPGDSGEHITYLTSHLGDSGEHITYLTSHLGDSGEHITYLTSHPSDSGDHITNLTSHLGDSGEHITYLTGHLGDSGDHITNLTSHLGDSGEHITNLTSHLGDSEDHITNLTSHLGDSGEHITYLTSHLGDSGDHITNLTSHLGDSGDHVTNLTSHQGDSGEHITYLTSHLGDSGDYITNLTSHLGDSGEHITNLTSHLGDDSNVKHTEKLFSFLDGQTDNSQDESDSESDKETPKKETNCKPLDNNDDDVTSGAERKTSITEELSNNPPQTYPPYNVTKQSLLDGELSFQSEPKVIKIELSKSQACGLGFSLVTAEKDNQTGVFVRSISAKGAADQDGRLQVMDRILQINGESLVGLTHTRAIQMIRKCKGFSTSNSFKKPLYPCRLSLRQLDVMTPPIIMNNSDDEDEDDYDVDEFSDGERYDDQQRCDSDDYEYDSEEEEEMNALVTAAEKLLAESGTIEFNQEQINDISNQGSFVEQMKDKWGDKLQQSDSEHSESDEEYQQINMEQHQHTNSEELQQTNTGEQQRTNTDELQQGNTNELEFTNTDYTQSSNIEELQQMNSDEEQRGNTANLELLQSEELPGVNSAELQQVNLEQLQQTNNEELQQIKSGEQTYLGELQQIDTNEFHEPSDNGSISQMDNDAKNKTFTIVALQRKLDVEIPDTVTDTWISSLPLLIMSEEARPSVPSLIKQIQHKIDQDDPVEEYKELRQVKATDDCTIARLPENKSKNRFRNILPYDLNRVTLSSENDYINASHILMSVGELESHYIACQGPLLNTSEDFWQMVWEQEVSVVTMLTLDIENRKVKCHQYWPDSMETPLFICEGKYKISLVSIQSLEHINIQTIEMSDLLSGRAHTVYHFTYKSWPDHGVPQSLPLLQCLQLVHVYHTTGPIVVHCSAGIGRTGAFITMDLVLGQIEKSGRCDIFEIVTELRKQRSGMIQTKDQYLLCYLACLEALTSVS